MNDAIPLQALAPKYAQPESRTDTTERETALRLEAQAAWTRLRVLQASLETVARSTGLERAERVRMCLEALVPRFARSITCHIPGEPTLTIGERTPMDHVLQTVITRTSGGVLIARRSTPFISEDAAVLLAASNAVALLYTPF